MTEQQKIEIIAERVMGWHQEIREVYISIIHGWKANMKSWVGENGHYIKVVSEFNPYKNIADAWLVWEQIVKNSKRCDEWVIYTELEGTYNIEHFPMDEYIGDREEGCGDWNVDGNTICEAICEAALKVVGI